MTTTDATAPTVSAPATTDAHDHEAQRLDIVAIYGDRVRLYGGRFRAFRARPEHTGPAWRVRAEWRMAVRRAEVDARIAEKPYDVTAEETWWSTREDAEAHARDVLDEADPLASGEMSATNPSASAVRRDATSVAWHSTPEGEALWQQTAEVVQVDPPRPTRYTVAVVRDAMDDAEAADYLRPWAPRDEAHAARLRATYCSAVRTVIGSSDDRGRLAYAVGEAERRANERGAGFRVVVEEARAVPLHLHRGGLGGWCLWSDGVLSSRGWTPSEALLAWAPESLSPIALELVAGALGSDSGAPAMGWLALAELREVVLDVVVEEGLPREGGYQPRTLRLIVATDGFGGAPREMWVWSVGYGEGYLFEVAATREEIDAHLERLGTGSGG